MSCEKNPIILRLDILCRTDTEVNMRPHQRLASIGLTIVSACFALMSTSMAHTAAAQDNGTLLADSGFRPEKDGFSFPNYSVNSDVSYTDMTAAEAHRMFGDAACE